MSNVPDRAAFLSSCARALVPGGTLLIVTTGHAQIGAHFLTRFFPSFAAVDQERFPDIPVIASELSDAGLDPVSHEPIVVARNTPAEYLEKVRRKHLSTFHLLDPDEYALGLTALEQYVASTPNALPIAHHGTLVWARTATD